MAKTLRIQTVIGGESVSINSTQALSDNRLTRSGIPLDEFPAAASEVQLKVTVDLDRTTALIIRGTTDFTMKTNSSSVPDDTITRAAGSAFVWHNQIGFGLEDIFAGGDITDMFFTNNDVEKAGEIEVVVLGDATIND